MLRRLLTLILLVATFSLSAQTAAERASLLYDEFRTISKAPTMGPSVADSDGEHFYMLDAQKGIVRRSYADAALCEQVIPDTETLAKLQIVDYAFSPQGALLISDGAKAIYRHSFTTRYWLYDGDSLREIITDVANKRDALFSPDGRYVAFSSDNNMWLYDVKADKSQRVTCDGEWNHIINGTTDWVYEEEFGFTKAFAFSPDGTKLAYLKFDENHVPMFEMMRFDGELYNRAYTFKYPKAGDPNSVVTLHLYDISSGKTTQIDTGSQSDQYIPHIGWTPAGELFFFRTNRRQNLFEVILNSGGEQRVIYSESSPRYIERPSASIVTFIDEERFVVREESSAGWWHLYLYSTQKGLLRPITQGEWEVTGVVACNDKQIWYTSTESSPLQRDLYAIDLKGKNKRRLTPADGWNSVQPSAGMRYFICNHSTAADPGSIAVYNSRGEVVRIISSVLPVESAPRREFFTWTTERGDVLNAYIIRPSDFDPQKRYPVLLTQYSGPGSQEVRDRWRPDWCDMLAKEGYIVACTDVRGTGFRGEEFKKQTYGDLGNLEREDQLSFARYLATKEWVDSERIGIYGWSYGGFMSLGCALKGEGLFKVAIAVAPVTSWRYYDSIYTETYNGLPQDNAAGYDDNSPLNFDERLSPRTRLLIIHGTADDNVHFQNSMEMARRLNAQGASYDMMVYPDQNHSMMPDDMRNVRCKMLSYVLENL